jgi:hypothetical protein
VNGRNGVKISLVGGLGDGFLATPPAKAVIATPVGAFAHAKAANRGCKAAFAIWVMAKAIGVGEFALGVAAIGLGKGRSVRVCGKIRTASKI